MPLLGLLVRRAAFFNTLMSKTGLMVARAAALRTKINIDGRPLCSLPSPPSDLVQGVATTHEYRYLGCNALPLLRTHAHILRQVKVESTATAAQPQSGVIQESRLTAQARCGACFLDLVYF